MAEIIEVIEFLENQIPLKLQEEYDNCGLLVGNPNNEIKGILIALDCTEKIIEEAIMHQLNLVITHHPVIFKGLKSIIGKSNSERAIIKALKNNISVYALHTNLDNTFFNGVNHKIASRLNLKNLSILRSVTKNSFNFDNMGSGILGDLPTSMYLEEILQRIKTAFHTKVIRYTEPIGKKIERIAICGGSGSFLLKDAIEKKADLFLSSDFKYHEFFEADNKIVIADIGHYESEQFTSELIFEILSQKFDTFALRCTQFNTNPINYYF